MLQSVHARVATLQDLTLPTTAVTSFAVAVELNGQMMTLDLVANDLRSRDYKLLVDDGTTLREVPRPANTMYRGAVRGDADSLVAATLFGGQLTAFVALDPAQPVWSVQPLSAVEQGAERRTHVVHYAGDGDVPAGTCGTPGAAVPTDGGQVLANGVDERLTFCEIANDDDYEFYLSNGSNVAQTEANSNGIIHACDLIYRRDTCIAYTITRTIVRTARVYTTNDYSQLLSAYRARWRSSHGDIRRDISHLFTGKSRTSGVIGVAYLGSICSTNTGYGLSFTNFTGNYASRVGLTAHELGHSWGSNHCSGSSCYLMCPSLGGCGNDVTRFGAASQAAITGFRDSRQCLDLSPFRQIGGAIPGQLGEPVLAGEGFLGSTLYPPSVTLRNYRPNALGVFVVGRTPIKQPFFGGTLIPSLDAVVGISGDGSDIVFDASSLPAVVENNLWVQSFYLDVAAPQGVSASHGHRIYIR